MKKSLKIFLWISSTVFTFSVIAILIGIKLSYNAIQTDFENDKVMQYNQFCWVIFLCVLFELPVLAEELSWIRSVYKLLKYKQKGFVKICYVISASLSFFAFVFHWLILGGCINFDNIENGQNALVTVLLWTEWPVVILSFLLGSVPNSKEDGLREPI